MTDVISDRLKAARGLWVQGRRTDALALFEEAIRQEPRNVQAYVAAARAYADAFDFARMEEILERLARLAPGHPGVHHYIGETFLSVKLPDRARGAFEQAAELPGAGPPTWLELAALCERAHRLDRADELIERTVRSGYDAPLVGLVKGRVERRRGRPDRAEATFLEAIRRAGDHSPWACQAWGELALMRDAEGDWEGAIAAIESCKRVQRSHEEPFLRTSAKTASAMGRLISDVTREHFQRWRAQTADFAPQRVALLTGFPRSGTTLLEQVLDAHPELVSSEERDYGGGAALRDAALGQGAAPILDTLDNLSRDEVAAQRHRYVAAMEYWLGEPIGSRMHLDKNPPYNLLIPLLLRMFPEMRLLIAVRDPRDVVLSCYLRYLPLNSVSVHFLDPRRTAKRYAFEMGAWLRLRDVVEAPWRQVRYEDMVANLEAEARKALGALDLPWNDAVLRYRDRLAGGKHVTSPTYEAVARPIHSGAIGRWRHYNNVLEPALEALEPFVREFGYET